MSGKEVTFMIPQSGWDPVALSDAVFSAGVADPVIGTGVPGLLVVCLDLDDDEDLAGAKILRNLPSGARRLTSAP